MRLNTQSQKIIIPMIAAAIGAVLGFSIFLFTGNIIFLIIFIPISLILGIALTHQPEDEKINQKPE
jgi:type IV secretory pathway VirB3-like protein